jgi:uncharacterized UPF0160 family protein
MRIVTHNGRFHADDIFAIATLLILYPEAEIIRSRDEEIIKFADIVVDTGLIYNPKISRFDHHQQGGAGERGNGIPYASFGLIWKEFGAQVSNIEIAKLIDEVLVTPIDAHDNGIIISERIFGSIREYTISDFFGSYIDNDNSEDETILYTTFLGCVSIARELLLREINIAGKELYSMEKVREIFDSTEDKRLIVLEEPLLWFRVLINEAITLYVVYPRKEGTWGVKAVPKEVGSYELRKPFPKEWGGRGAKELVEITGVEDAVFCHNKLFICSARTKEGAIALAMKALLS